MDGSLAVAAVSAPQHQQQVSPYYSSTKSVDDDLSKFNTNIFYRSLWIVTHFEYQLIGNGVVIRTDQILIKSDQNLSHWDFEFPSR